MPDTILCTIEGCPVTLHEDGHISFTADADIDADGANGHGGGLPCYAPRSYTGKTLDDLACAGHPGNWWGVVTRNGEPTGEPIIQGPGDPAPGAYVSATSLILPRTDGTYPPPYSPDRYVDADKVPFIVLPSPVAKGVAPKVLGCFARVTYRGKTCDCVVADKGPTRKIGELSPEAARRVGMNPSARSGGEDQQIVRYEVWPGQPATIDGVTYPLQSW